VSEIGGDLAQDREKFIIFDKPISPAKAIGVTVRKVLSIRTLEIMCLNDIL
jgi:hypothetical protein